MFADNTMLVAAGKDVKKLEKGINSNLKLYFQWLCYIKLTINVKKVHANKTKKVVKVILNNPH